MFFLNFFIGNSLAVIVREFFVIFAPMGKYVYIVDYNKGDVFDYEGVFSTHKKADDYVDELIESYQEEGYRVSNETRGLFNIYRCVHLVKKGRSGGTILIRINQILVQ